MTVDLWQRFQALYFQDASLGFSLDVSRVLWPSSFLEEMHSRVQDAFVQMQALEDGGVANPDEGRQVGHYWLRTPDRAPEEFREQILDGIRQVKSFAADIHEGRIRPPRARRFKQFLLLGIGGSALGPQLADHVLSGPGDPLRAFFIDNTDPDGFDRVMLEIGPDLNSTLIVVVSKSGETRETRNAMIEVRKVHQAAGLSFARHAVAVTGPGSSLDRLAQRQGWLRRFPLQEWIGGRTSQTSVVGLLPAALSGFDVTAFLDGARRMDELTRNRVVQENPSALLALSWFHLTGGRGAKDMVILPYKDRLAPLSRYLQQLVMESLGKEHDLEGRVVHQGITVYGNKGSTDQHAYVQQLRDGVPNFFVTFLQVLEDRAGGPVEIEPGVTSGDYLAGFLLGTRKALFEKGRESLTISVPRLDETSLGAIIALFERAVGFYASLVGVNAYHQPGVEAGKKAAGEIITLQVHVLGRLRANPGKGFTVEELAEALGAPEAAESIFHILTHLAANPGRGIRREAGSTPFTARYLFTDQPDPGP
ncbi:MAG: glucose-6-phosphate isomerase [Acidobacteriota bacterium]